MSLRTPRIPSQTSVSQLFILGLLDYDDVNRDGTVSEHSRVLAERQYTELHNTRTTRPATTHPLRRSRVIEVQRPSTSRNTYDNTSSHITRIKCLKKLTVNEIDSLKNLEKRQLKLEACCICYGRTKSHAIVPCFHLCVCEDCGKKINRCPLCREPATTIQKIYI